MAIMMGAARISRIGRFGAGRSECHAGRDNQDGATPVRTGLTWSRRRCGPAALGYEHAFHYVQRNIYSLGRTDIDPDGFRLTIEVAEHQEQELSRSWVRPEDYWAYGRFLLRAATSPTADLIPETMYGIFDVLILADRGSGHTILKAQGR